MFSEFWNWLLGVVISAGMIGFVAYLLRATIGKFFAKAVEHRFEKKLETFKAGIRDTEKELDQIRSFLVAARRDRDSAVQSKRLEAAETLLRARHAVSQLSMLVEYMKILNTEQILKEGDDPKIAEFMDALAKPFNVDEKIALLGTIDMTIPRLYLSDQSLKNFDAYKSIVLQAAMMMKVFSIPLSDKGDLFTEGELSKMIIELAPISKASFDKWGEGHAYYWSTYFHDEILRALRHEVSGADDRAHDAESVECLALDSRRAQINIRSSLEQTGLSDSLIKPNEGTAESSVAAKKASE
ncbi:hypothetical protein [Pararhizobium sp. IMCC21322]|uniref:hypothetical protein n=1 Tax=Pararhizobium sp. IMCC21322 TaxID=3067903 RepID=UPI0027412CD1|nr:hypothetical protein [Pararhizobium sp. IMCC21322]